MMLMSLDLTKSTQSSVQPPKLSTLKFFGGKLASIGRKIEEKEVLLAGGVPHQLLKHLDRDLTHVPEPSTNLHTSFVDNRTTTKVVENGNSVEFSETGGGETKVEKVQVLCEFCSHTFPQDRISLHRRFCSDSAENMRRVPFIVKLGLQQVDGDRERVTLLRDEAHTEEYHELADQIGQRAKVGMGFDDGVEEKENQRWEPLAYEDNGIQPLPRPDGYPGGGNNWIAEHKRYMRSLVTAKTAIEMFSCRSIPELPPPPGSCELEVEYIQCPSCLLRFTPKYNASEHLAKCRGTQPLFCKRTSVARKSKP